ncbi:MAG TPA: 1,4-dihydroxy-2-naphthoate octaprenyltransferase [Thermoleophilaceae bacterium]|nr:1,4-dihydroxy-2-naphthoate octaprenyltransferase [Thermoleophilaceae bacterium]
MASKAGLALQATRPLYIPTSLIPGLAGLAVAIHAPGVTWWLAPVALLALVLVHAGTNVINDVEDFQRGVDTEDKMDNSRVFNTGLMSLADGRRLAVGLFAAGLALGVVIAAVQGPLILAFGVVGAGVGYGYSAGPRPLKYAGLGDVAIVPVMGPLITQGVYTSVTGDAFHAAAFWLGLGPGLLIGAVLAANNLSDIPGDRAAGVRTLAVRLGFSRARAGYLALLALPYATVAALVAAGLFGWPLLVALLTVPLAVQRGAQALAAPGEGDQGLVTLAPGTAQLHLLFSLLLVAGVVIDRAVL